MIKRIAVTQRVVENESYPERRDALAQDWSAWLESVLPGCACLAVPNRPEILHSWIDAALPDAVVFTGGNDWGDAPERDETEAILFAQARAGGLPVFGVCRGMQALNILLGGSVVTVLSETTEQQHVSQNHMIRLSASPVSELAGSATIQVNSFHGQGVTKDDLAPEVISFAEAADGVIEGLYHEREPILAIQWHPERNNPTAEFDIALATALFERGAFWVGAPA